MITKSVFFSYEGWFLINKEIVFTFISELRIFFGNVEFQITSAAFEKYDVCVWGGGDGRSDGPGGINFELSKYGSKSIVRILNQLYNRILA